MPAWKWQVPCWGYLLCALRQYGRTYCRRFNLRRWFCGRQCRKPDKRTSSYSLSLCLIHLWRVWPWDVNWTERSPWRKAKSKPLGHQRQQRLFVYVCLWRYGYELGDFIDATGKFVGAFDSNLSNIGKAASAIGGVAGVANGVFTILKMTGVIEDSTDRKLKRSSAVDMISSKVDGLTENYLPWGMSLKVPSPMLAARWQGYLHQRSGGWNAYVKTDVGNMQKMISEYEEHFARALYASLITTLIIRQ